jgi:FkbM family methyltransferase
MTKLKRLLWATHPVWSTIIPHFYHPYRFAGGRIYLDIKESPMMLSRALGLYEAAKQAALRTFLRGGDTFIDVGANKGDFSLVASRIVGSTGQVIAFEPAPENCEWMRKSITLNGYDNIRLYQFALSDANGSATLHLGEKSGFHSLLRGLPRRRGDSIGVEVRRLDDFLPEAGYQQPIGMVKIDVEGGEMDVLRGAKETLLQNDEVVVAVEVHREFGVDVEMVFAYLEDLGFRLYEERPPFTMLVDDRSTARSVIAMRRRIRPEGHLAESRLRRADC